MSLFISSVFTYDEDAGNYIQAVETADAQALEPATRKAINNFVIGCKQDGIWTAIKASCILAGARTRLGALTPLVGTAPTPFGFVDANYNRKTGLKGATSSKYLNPARANNADPQDSRHMCVFATEADSGTGAFFMGSDSLGFPGASGFFSLSGIVVYRLAGTANITLNNAVRTGLLGASRSSSPFFYARQNKTNTTVFGASVAPSSSPYLVFARTGQAPGATIDARLAFYSIGEGLDLALLDARVTDLINAFAVTIP
jgi:hypothetical protein